MSSKGKRMLLTGVLTVALTGGGVAVSSAPAMAGVVTPMGNAPSCVRVWSTSGTISQTGYAANLCGYSQNLKIVWAYGADGPCVSVPHNYQISDRIPIQPRRFDGASTC